MDENPYKAPCTPEPIETGEKKAVPPWVLNLIAIGIGIVYIALLYFAMAFSRPH